MKKIAALLVFSLLCIYVMLKFSVPTGRAAGHRVWDKGPRAPSFAFSAMPEGPRGGPGDEAGDGPGDGLGGNPVPVLATGAVDAFFPAQRIGITVSFPPECSLSQEDMLRVGIDDDAGGSVHLYNGMSPAPLPYGIVIRALPRHERARRVLP